VTPKSRCSSRIGADLVLGAAGVLALAVAALYGPVLAPHDVNFVVALRDGQAPPFPPSADLPLGSDELGRDLWSWVLIGARTTMGVAIGAAALRVVIGAFLGTMAGWQGGRLDRALSSAALGFTAIPATVLAALAVIAFNVYAGPLAFVLALGVLGWGETFQLARRSARVERGRPYIEAARSLGLAEQRVVLGHLAPNIAGPLIALTGLQVSAVLLLLAELGLLQIFIGGGSVEYSSSGIEVRVPASADWSSMLAATRPIRIVGGQAVWPLLAPALALVCAIGSVNLLSDALARRAQRVNVFAALDRRRTAVVGGVLAILLAPMLLVPNRLARDVDYARAIDASLALAVTEQLAAPELAGRSSGSAGAHLAAIILREHLQGTLLPLHTRVPSPDLRLATRVGELSAGPDLALYSLDDASIAGPVIAMSPRSLSRSEGDVQGAIVVLSGLVVADAERTATLAASLGAVALIYATDGELPFPALEGRYAIPVLRANPDALERLAEHRLPDGFDLNRAPPTLLTESATISVAVRYKAVDGDNVVAREPARLGLSDAPLIVVAAPSDEPGPPRYLEPYPGWASASAAGLLAAVRDRVRRDPLPAEFVFAAVVGHEYDAAGLRAVLASLGAAERSRTVAIVYLASATGVPALQSDAADRNSPTTTSASARIARKVADALSLRTQSESSRTLMLAGRTADVSAPTFTILGVSSETTAPSISVLRQNGLAALTLLSYLSQRPLELTR